MRILMLPGSLVSPPARFRVFQYLKPLGKAGHQVIVRVIKPDRKWSSSLFGKVGQLHTKLGALVRIVSALWLTRDSATFDIVFMQRDIFPETSITFLEPLLQRRRNNLVFDFDDAIFLGERDRKMRRFLPVCSLIIAGNDYLANYARSYSDKVVIVPTVVDTERYLPSAVRKNSIPCIGWSGSSSTVSHDLPEIWPILERLSKEFTFEFLVVADTPPKNTPCAVRVEFMPWSPENEVAALQQMDIGLMPLVDGPLTRGKCGAKLITYGAVGIPSVASAVGANNEVIVDKVTGFLCHNDDEWIRALSQLLTNKSLRVQMGIKAREHVEENYSLNAWAPVLARYLDVVSKN